MSSRWTLGSLLSSLTGSSKGQDILSFAHLTLITSVALFVLGRALTGTVYVDWFAETMESLFLLGLFLSALLSILNQWYGKLTRLDRRHFIFVEIFLLHGLASFGSAPSFFTLMLILQIALVGYELGRSSAVLYGIWSATCFNLFLIFSETYPGQVVAFHVLSNNLSLIGAGVLGGLFRGQLANLRDELRQRDERIDLLSELNRLIIESIPTGLLTIDNSGRVIHTNPAARNIIDWMPWAQVEKGDIGEIFPQTPFLNWISKGEHKESLETSVKDVNDEMKYLKVFLSPIRNQGSQSLGYLVGIEDQTQVRRLQESIRQSEKLAAVGQLAAGIAHEIRNPLASISGSVQMLEGMLSSSSDEGGRLIKIITREIDRLNNMITEFLDFVRPDKSELKEMSLDELAQEVVELLKADPSFSVVSSLDVDLPQGLTIKGDWNKLKQALLNVCINACQAMAGSENSMLKVSGGRGDGLVWVEVQDNGMGMDEKTQKRIFEPFLTTKPKGTGLGLSVTHRIIENHEGRIIVQSELKRGSKFRFEFPEVLTDQ